MDSARKRPNAISVIVPALNEAENIAETLARAGGAFEIIVADGGSRDGTRDIARAAGARVLETEPGRARQMNAGASDAKGEVFLFLHADTWLPPEAFANVALALRNPAVVGGAFARRFRAESLFLRMTCALAGFRNWAIGWHLGDQAIFCRAAIFRELGGFTPLRAFEDVDFSRRLGRQGKLVTLRPPVWSSARRFEGGAFSRTARDLGLTMRYLLRPERFRV